MPTISATNAEPSETYISFGTAAEIPPDPIDRPLQDIEQDDRPHEVHEVNGLVRCVLLLGHGVLIDGSATAGRGDRT